MSGYRADGDTLLAQRIYAEAGIRHTQDGPGVNFFMLHGSFEKYETSHILTY